jgi:protein TonB
VRVSSSVENGLLLSKVEPVYPSVAHRARIQGTVFLQALIGKDGNVEHLELISGHPLLAPAAIDAVKQWKYKPFLLDGRAVEVQTEVRVNFSLQNDPSPGSPAPATQPQN